MGKWANFHNNNRIEGGVLLVDSELPKSSAGFHDALKIISTGEDTMRDQKGFTLIELLIVVVIIGILAAIAIPKFSSTREKAYFAAMKSDLKNLASQQEIYYADNYSYTNSETALGFVDSEGVTVTITATPSGWNGAAVHTALPSKGCAIYYGTAGAPSSPATPTAAGEVACAT
jgi:type II secretion system protein G